MSAATIHAQARRLRPQAGSLLLELAIAVMVVAIALATLWRSLGLREQDQQDALLQRLRIRADAALLAYAFTKHRLPCPASDGSGQESCGPAEGKLPYRTLGLPDPRAGKLDYRVANALSTPPAPLQVLTSTLPAMDPQTTPLAALVAAPVPAADFCASLLQPGSTAAQAYAVALAHAPARATSFGELGSTLGCQALVAHSGRAHFNMVLAAQGRLRAIQDVRDQLKVANDIAALDAGLFPVFVLNSSVTLAKALTSEEYGLMVLYSSLYTNPAAFARSLANYYQALENLVRNSATQASLAVRLQNIKAANAHTLQLEKRFEALHAGIDANARRAASSAYFLDAQ